MRKQFIKALGLQDTLEAEQDRFVQRINQLIFLPLETTQARELGRIFCSLCVELGVHDFDIRAAYDRRYGNYIKTSDARQQVLFVPPLRVLTNDDFIKTLEVLACLYRLVPGSCNAIPEILARTTLDIGVEWKAGLFYKKGVEPLDRALLEDGLDFLAVYPHERQLFRETLKEYLAKEYPDVIRKGHLVVEGLAKRLLGNEKTLDENKEQLVSRLGIREDWKHMLKYYLQYAHKARHGSMTPVTVSPIEADAFLYMTGLMIRLIVQAID